MAVYREGYKMVEELMNSQRQIWNDAPPHGIIVSKGDKNWNLASNLVAMYGIPESRKVTKFLTGETVTSKVKLVDEWAVSDERKSYKLATDIFLVSFTSQGKNQILEINRLND